VTRNTTNKYQNFEVVDPERWVPYGYGCIRVDSRGAGRSPGYLNPFSPRESQDLHDCIEWAATLPWCNGKVGLAGISYYVPHKAVQHMGSNRRQRRLPTAATSRR
jgi:putative CocE/NonD family hydrolase